MTAEQRQVLFGKSVIDYRLERSDRRKTVTIAVDPSAGVLVKAPSDTPMRRLDSVVEMKGPWILQRLVECRELGPGPAPKEFVAGESYSYLGRNYRLKIDGSAVATTPVASLHGAFLTVSVPRGEMVQKREVIVRHAVVAWYRRQAHRRLTERVGLYAERAGVRPPPVLVRDQVKRWGSCNSRGELRFNWRVIMASLPLVDYVVAHEVSHLVVRDHSPRFWRLLGVVLPDYEARRARLRVDGVRFDV